MESFEPKLVKVLLCAAFSMHTKYIIYFLRYSAYSALNQHKLPVVSLGLYYILFMQRNRVSPPTFVRDCSQQDPVCRSCLVVFLNPVFTKSNVLLVHVKRAGPNACTDASLQGSRSILALTSGLGPKVYINTVYGFFCQTIIMKANTSMKSPLSHGSVLKY